LDEVEELCDSVLILDSGKIRAQGTVLELKRQFGPPGDQLHLEKIPDYVPKEWIINEQTNYIQIPDRNGLIGLLNQLDRDKIKYSLENITLDDIFLKLTSESESSSGKTRKIIDFD
jgi:ABC-type multidrug transport system ATPase subunit